MGKEFTFIARLVIFHLYFQSQTTGLRSWFHAVHFKHAQLVLAFGRPDHY